MRTPLPHEETTRTILEACFEVSNELGAGFVESVYEEALVIALRQKGLKAQA
jgi:GxxExxY protein